MQIAVGAQVIHHAADIAIHVFGHRGVNRHAVSQVLPAIRWERVPSRIDLGVKTGQAVVPLRDLGFGNRAAG